MTCGAGRQCVNEEMKKMGKQVSAPVETKAKGMSQQWCLLLSQEATVELSGAKQKVVRELILAVVNYKSNCGRSPV